MSSEWMGRYRPLVAALVKHGNAAVNGLKRRREILPGVKLTSTEWQVLETVIEHALTVTNMNQLAALIGIPQSTFSKTVSFLCALGLMEKYQTAGNKKNVILRPTELGMEAYRVYAGILKETVFEGFFKELEDVDDGSLEALVRALEQLDSGMEK